MCTQPDVDPTRCAPAQQSKRAHQEPAALANQPMCVLAGTWGCLLLSGVVCKQALSFSIHINKTEGCGKSMVKAPCAKSLFLSLFDLFSVGVTYTNTRELSGDVYSSLNNKTLNLEGAWMYYLVLLPYPNY